MSRLRFVEEFFPARDDHKTPTMGGDERDGADLLAVCLKNFLRHTGGTVEVASFSAVLDLDTNLLVHGSLRWVGFPGNPG